MEPGEGPFDHQTVDAQSGAVWGPAAGDRRDDASGSDLVAVAVVVVAAVREE